jgi:hypothetical protein
MKFSAARMDWHRGLLGGMLMGAGARIGRILLRVPFPAPDESLRRPGRGPTGLPLAGFALAIGARYSIPETGCGEPLNRLLTRPGVLSPRQLLPAAGRG